ncbi:DEAD/DEAH box helicase family protein [Candidatus Pacearchaeota archaeon]|nr:DEAD/DEAH box helicase family protein [Candidatus Pacearchaeota archaeon]
MLTPRKYQTDILNTCKEKNCLVVLPTGTGKTLIALMLARERINKYPESKILFLAPTRPLAEQHLEYFKKNLSIGYDCVLFTGKVHSDERKKLWQNNNIIFSTPQCVSNDLRNSLYNLKDVSLLIEDEAHRCIKNYDYTYVAQKYKEQAVNAHIIGLTASPGYDKSTIKEICNNLGVEAVEVRTRQSDDVKRYLQKLEFETIEVDFPNEFEAVRNPLKELFNRKIEELKNRKLLFAPATKKNLLDLQQNIMRRITTGERNFNYLAGASACATAIKLQHALELLETQTLQSLNNYIQDLFKQASSKKSRAVQQLIKNKEFNQAYTLLIELLASKKEHPKLAKIKELVEQEINENKKSKIIVFSQYRDSVTRICKELNTINGIIARVFVGQAKKGLGKDATGLSQREQKELLNEFALGKINLIVSTSIGEEGLDLPEVNAVIFYDNVPSEIRKIQRSGRTARLKPGKLFILITKGTRDASYYWAAFHKERKMQGILKNLNKDFENENSDKKQLDLDNFTNSIG